MEKFKTTMYAISPNARVMTGRERYPIIGSTGATIGLDDGIHTQEDRNALEYAVISMLPECAGLKACWDCLAKAQLVYRHMESTFGVGGRVMMGSMRIWNTSYTASYGYAFEPPREFHAWYQRGLMIIDIALPGVVIKGTNTIDDVGPIITGREPAILVGIPPKWAEYEGMGYLNSDGEIILMRMTWNKK